MNVLDIGDKRFYEVSVESVRDCTEDLHNPIKAEFSFQLRSNLCLPELKEIINSKSRGVYASQFFGERLIGALIAHKTIYICFDVQSYYSLVAGILEIPEPEFEEK